MWLVIAFALAAEGRALFEKNQFDQARATLQRALRSNPGDREARYWLAFAHLALSDYEASIREFERIERHFSNDPEFLFAASEAYTRRARQLSEILSARDDSSARRHQHLAHRHLAREDQYNALTEFELALRCNAKLPGLNEERAEILWTGGKLDEAVQSVQAELAVNSAAFQANLRYGQFLLQERNPEAAVPYLRAAALHRRYPEAYQLLAYAFRQLGKWGEEQGVIAAGLEIFPDDAELAGMRNALVKPVPYRQGPPPPSTIPSLATLRARPNTDDSLFFLHRIYSGRAVELSYRLEQVAPDSPRLSQLKGLNFEYVDDYPSAELHYREALRRAPHTAGLRFALGHVLRLQGKDEQAEAELARDAQNHLTLYERALIRSGRGDFKGTVALLEEAVKLSPRFSHAQIELAKAYLQTGEAGKAVRVLTSVVGRTPGHPTAHFLLGRAYRALNEHELARKELDLHRRLMEQDRSQRVGIEKRPARPPVRQ